MTKKDIQKNIRLSLDFDTYVSKHPRVLRSIPNGAHIILTTTRDKKLSEANRDIARKSRSKKKFLEAQKEGKRWTIQPVVVS